MNRETELIAEGMTEELLRDAQFKADMLTLIRRGVTMPRIRIERVEPLPGFRLRLGLSDGRTIERDLSREVREATGPMIEPLKDPAFFARVSLSADLDTVVWPNGYDMDPDTLIANLPPE